MISTFWPVVAFFNEGWEFHFSVGIRLSIKNTVSNYIREIAIVGPFYAECFRVYVSLSHFAGPHMDSLLLSGP